MNIYHVRKQLEQSKERLINAVLPDTCNLQPSANGYSTDAFGIITPVVAALREWRGTTDIPCRFDISRAMRNDRLDVQTTVVTEYHVDLPYDLEVDENDWLIHNGVTYEIKRLKAASDYDLTREVTVAAANINTGG